MTASSGVIRPNIPCNGTGVVFSEFVFSSFFIVVNHKFTVCTVANIFSRYSQQLHHPTTTSGNLIELWLRSRWVLAVFSQILACRSKNDPLIIRAKGIGMLVGTVVGQSGGRTAGGIHSKHIKITIAVRSKSDRLAVFTPNSFVIVSLMKGQLARLTPADRNRKQVTFIGKNDGFTIRRNRRITHPLGVDLGD